MIVLERHCGHGELLLENKEDKGEKFYPGEKTCQLNDSTIIEVWNANLMDTKVEESDIGLPVE